MGSVIERWCKSRLIVCVYIVLVFFLVFIKLPLDQFQGLLLNTK